MLPLATVDDQRVRPHANSYWVIPGKMLAGEYPRELGVTGSRAKLGAIVGAGIRSFVDLTEPHELHGYSELLDEISSIAGVTCHYNRFPIVDGSIPGSVDTTTEILDTIDRSLSNAHPVYVHCWGGIGRTGTIVGCFLIRHGLSGDEALECIASWWSTVEKVWRQPRSPETDIQFDYVRAWGHRTR